MSEKYSQNYAFSAIFKHPYLQILRTLDGNSSRPESAMRPDASHSEETRLIDVVFPDRANHYGTLFGGNALHLMGKAAFIAATRHSRQHVVMASSDNITFDEPVRVGDLVECVASIARVGGASMTVAVELIHEDALIGLRRSAVRGTFEMVAVDANGRPTRISESHGRSEIREEAVP
jgi:acyl-CoA hydrolase